MFKDDMDEIKRILKEGLLRNNGKYILLAMTALFLFLYGQKQERITPQLLSMEVFGCKNYIVSRKEADQDPKGRQTYRIGMSCQEAEKTSLVADAVLWVVEDEKWLQNQMLTEFKTAAESDKESQRPCDQGCLRSPVSVDTATLDSITNSPENLEQMQNGSAAELNAFQFSGLERSFFFIRQNERVMAVQLSQQMQLTEEEIEALLGLFNADLSFIQEY